MDIETVPLYYQYYDMPMKLRELWNSRVSKAESAEIEYYEKASLYAEFAKVVCVSLGVLRSPEVPQVSSEGVQVEEFYLKSFVGDEKQILLDLSVIFKGRSPILCGHNIKNFDLPFLFRRFHAHEIAVPVALNLLDKKPWQVPHRDTMEMWQNGSRSMYASLDLLAYTLGFDSSKQKMTGKDVPYVYYIDQDIGKIQNYCEADVRLTYDVYARLMKIQ
jgi:3'-5' exonuclease